MHQAAYQVDAVDRTDSPTAEELAREVELHEQEREHERQLQLTVQRLKRGLRYGTAGGVTIRSREEDR